LANSADTAFRIGGITRTFTAAAILKLVGEKKISVDDPLNKYLPETSGKKNGRITIHQLLAESSGIPDYIPTWRTAWKMSFGGKKEPPNGGTAGLTRGIISQPCIFEPGSRTEFSHSNSMILGQVIERVEKKPFTAWMRSWLESLSLRRTGFDIAAENTASGRAFGYPLFPNIDPRSWKKPAQRKVADDIHPEWNLSASSMYSTTHDLARWLDIIVQKEALARPERDKLFARHFNKTENQWVGYGWNIYNVGNLDIVAQVGASTGFYSILLYIPSRELSVVILSNYGETFSNRQKLLQELLTAVTL
jgi:CubicO group peptidase (beta-lactamase class C family)